VSIIPKMTEPFGRAVVLAMAGAFALGSDQRREPPVAQVAILGTGEPASDPLCKRIENALTTRRRPGARELLVHCLRAEMSSLDQLRSAVSHLADAPPTVYIAPTGLAAKAAMDAARRGTPVVFASFADPQAAGFVSSSPPNTMPVTGVSLADTWHAKRLEVLKDAFPQVKRVGILIDRWWPEADEFKTQLVRSATRRGLQVVLHLANDRAELDRLMHSAAASEVDAWYLPSSFIAYNEEEALVQHMSRLGLPAMHSTRREVERGGLMAFWSETEFAYDAMAELTLRILAGEAAGQIPVERPRRFTLSARLSDDPRLAIAPSVLRRAEIVR
jgi:putative ABC transport system substrate-binding protein